MSLISVIFFTFSNTKFTFFFTFLSVETISTIFLNIYISKNYIFSNVLVILLIQKVLSRCLIELIKRHVVTSGFPLAL